MTENYAERLLELLSLDYNCSPGDFRRSENVLTVSALHEGRRQFSPERAFFQHGDAWQKCRRHYR